MSARKVKMLKTVTRSVPAPLWLTAGGQPKGFISQNKASKTNTICARIHGKMAEVILIRSNSHQPESNQYTVVKALDLG